MKPCKRWLSILLCVCLWYTSMVGGLNLGLAEEGLSIEFGDSVVAGQAGDEQNGLDESGEDVLPLAEVVQDAPPEEQASSDDEGESTVEHAGLAPEFAFGYARILEFAPLYLAADSEEKVQAIMDQNGIVLVISRFNDGGRDRLNVEFVSEKVIWHGWMDATVLRPMTEAEVSAFQDTATEAVCHEDDVNYPLPEPAFAVQVVEDAEETPEPTEAPLETLDPEGSQESDDPDDGRDDTVNMVIADRALQLSVGRQQSLDVAFSDGVQRLVNYANSDSSIASVDGSGLVTAYADGTTEITVICPDLAVTEKVSVTVAGFAPVVTEVPAETDVPVITEAPAETDVPVITEVPAATEEPSMETVPPVEPIAPTETAALEEPEGGIAFEKGIIHIINGQTVDPGVVITRDGKESEESYTLASSDTGKVRIEGTRIRAVATGTVLIRATTTKGETAEATVVVRGTPTKTIMGYTNPVTGGLV
ncbi:MAG: Ig-like domain-containing protein, partial [Christensenellales bacterium]|nr:Ig-like domain-containing protein [Christensenellales bacterium]